MRLVEMNPDIALPKPGKGTSKTLQLRIFRKLGVTEDVTLGEVPVSSGNPAKRGTASSQRCRPAFAEAATRRQVQSFSSTPARFP